MISISLTINGFLFHLDDQCQFWLDETAGVLTSPYFDGLQQHYGHSLNCIWTLKATEGYYINLEIDFFRVYSKMTNYIIYLIRYIWFIFLA